MHRVIAAVLLLLLAGCVAEESPADDRPAAPAPTHTSPGDERPEGKGRGSGGMRQPPAVNYTVDFAGCKGIFGTGDVPVSQVEGILPDAFNPSGFTPGTVGIGFQGLVCYDVAAGASTHSDVVFFQTQLFVEPVNSSWSMPAALNWYVLDAWTAGFEIPGLVFDEAAQFEWSNTTATVHWRAMNESVGFEISVPVSGESGGSGEAKEFYWYGDGPFQRVDSDTAYTYDRIQTSGTVLLVEGEGRTAAAFGSAVPSLSSGITLEMSWLVDPASVFE